MFDKSFQLYGEKDESIDKKRLDLERVDRHRFLLRPTDNVKLRWDLFVMFGAIINCVTIPLKVSFEPASMETTTYHTCSIFIDILFVLDMVVSLRTSYVNDFGEEEMDPKKIAIHYFKFFFMIDLIATVPIDSVINWVMHKPHKELQLFGIMKLGRLFKL